MERERKNQKKKGLGLNTKAKTKTELIPGTEKPEVLQEKKVAKAVPAPKPAPAKKKVAKAKPVDTMQAPKRPVFVGVLQIALEINVRFWALIPALNLNFSSKELEIEILCFAFYIRFRK